MMARNLLSKASASSAGVDDWKSIDWNSVVTNVRQLQIRIAKAYREGRHGKVKALQRLLTTSYHPKLLAVRRVVQNRGSHTPGIDGVIWSTHQQKMEAARSLKRRGYKTKPLKRIYIKKKDGIKSRPLSIPTMLCRAQQSLYLLALDPIAETIADKNSYGFRPLRSTADAIEQCFNVLCRKTSAEYIMEGDIKGCFENIDKYWLCNNIPIDKVMLKKWLDAGYIEDEKLYPTERGVAQGGSTSPTILVITLSGLEVAVKAAVRSKDKVNVCVYANDFIITGATPEILEKKVKPVVISFLKERGLTLSEEKTKITHINDGFDFLGTNIRKYNGKCIIKPAKSNVKRFLSDVRSEIKKQRAAKTEDLIYRLNQKIRGWSNYFRHVCSKQTFNYVDSQIFQAIWRWAVRRHPNKGKRWIKARYFHQTALKGWIFSEKVTNEKGEVTWVRLAEAKKTSIKRHVKIKSKATPYDPTYHVYLGERLQKRLRERQISIKPKWWLLWRMLLNIKDRKAGSPEGGFREA